MSIKVLFFAQAQRWAGRTELERTIDRPVRISDLLKWAELSALEDRLTGVRFAVNQEFAGPEDWVKDGDEVAVLPARRLTEKKPLNRRGTLWKESSKMCRSGK